MRLTKIIVCFYFLFHCAFVQAQKQDKITWAVSANTVISGVNLYSPSIELWDYFHKSHLVGHSIFLDMSVPVKNSKSFSWHANLGYLKSGFKGRRYVARVESVDGITSFEPFRHEEWSNINFNHVMLGGFIGYRRGKINLQLGGKILYLIRTIDKQQTVFLTQDRSANIYRDVGKIPIKGFRVWDIGPQMNLEIHLRKGLFLNTSFYYGSNEVTGTLIPRTLVLEKRVYSETGLKYYFSTF